MSPVADMSMDIDGHEVVPLLAETWDLFAGMAGRTGLFGGCWCVHFHCLPDPPEREEMGNPAFKRMLVEQGVAHAALVLDDGEAVAWAEYGTLTELPNIQHRKQWEAETVVPPDFRITCVQGRKDHRRRGLGSVAVRGAVALVAAAGGAVSSPTRTTSRPARRCRRRSSTTSRGPPTRTSGSPTSGPRGRATA